MIRLQNGLWRRIIRLQNGLWRIAVRYSGCGQVRFSGHQLLAFWNLMIRVRLSMAGRFLQTVNATAAVKAFFTLWVWNLRGMAQKHAPS